jgi:hypothetical protein
MNENIFDGLPEDFTSNDAEAFDGLPADSIAAVMRIRAIDALRLRADESPDGSTAFLANHFERHVAYVTQDLFPLPDGEVIIYHWPAGGFLILEPRN